jgi:cytochrome P450
VCIGATLAMTEATLILAVLAQRFRLRLKEPQEIKLKARITLRPKNGMLTILERRRPAAQPGGGQRELGQAAAR